MALICTVKFKILKKQGLYGAKFIHRKVYTAEFKNSGRCANGVAYE